MFKFSKFWTFSLILAGCLLCFNNLSWAKPPHQKLSSMPEGSYQLARSVFLPNASDDIWLSNYDALPNVGGKYTDVCSKQGYILKSCPSNGNCTTCPMDNSYKKLISCASGYKVSSSKTYCEKVCPQTYCNTSVYFSTTCPEGTVCETCTAVASNCSETQYFKPTTTCLSGFHYSGGRCVKDCTVVNCTTKWTGECPKGYLCTESGTYMTADCQTGKCYNYKACDEANGYFKPSGVSPGVCEYLPCYKSTNNCSNYTLTQCPENGNCSKCTVKKSDCSYGDTKYKLDSCDDGYEMSSSKTACYTQCSSFRFTSCPNNAECGKCNVVANDGTLMNSKYSFLFCKEGYINQGTNSSPYCTNTSCKKYLETSGGSVNFQKIFVSSQDELEQAIKDRTDGQLGVYEYQIVISDSFVLEGKTEGLDGANIKGIREVLPSGVYEDACPKPTLFIKDAYIPKTTTFAGVDFSLGESEGGIYGGGTYTNCNFSYGDPNSNQYASSYWHIALTEESHFDTCTMDNINMTLSGNKGASYYFDNIYFKGGTITPIGNGTANLYANSNFYMQDGAHFGGTSSNGTNSESTVNRGAYFSTSSPGLIFNVYGNISISSPNGSAAFHNTVSSYKKGSTSYLAPTTTYIYANMSFSNTTRLVLAYQLYDKNSTSFKWLEGLDAYKYKYYIKSSTGLPSTLVGYVGPIPPNFSYTEALNYDPFDMTDVYK